VFITSVLRAQCYNKNADISTEKDSYWENDFPLVGAKKFPAMNMNVELGAELHVLSAAMREGQWSVQSAGRLSREEISRYKVYKRFGVCWTVHHCDNWRIRTN